MACYREPIYDIGDLNTEHFNSINGDKYKNDNSMIGTLRAYCLPFLKSEETIKYNLRQFDFDDVDSPIEFLLNDVCLTQTKDNTFNVNTFEKGFRYGRDARSKVIYLDEISEIIKEQFPGWEEVKPISEFYKVYDDNAYKSLVVRAFIHRETKSIQVFVNGFDMVNESYSRYHYFQIGIFRCFPWFYDSKNLGIKIPAFTYAIAESIFNGDMNSYLFHLDFAAHMILNELKQKKGI